MYYSRKRRIRRRRIKKIVIFAFIIGLIICFVSLFKNDNGSKKVQKVKIQTKEIKEKKEKRMSLIAAGDCLIHDSIYLDAQTGPDTYDFSKILKNVEPLIKDYDLKFYNQETIIGGKDIGLSNYPLFNSPEEIGDGMVNIGFNMVSLANNHSLDKGEQGILHSNEYWKNKKVMVSGTNSSFEERDNIKVYEQNGIKFAYIAYTTITNGLKVPEGKEYLVNLYSNEQASSDIEKIKDKVDVIIVSMHWGSEYTHEPVDEEKEIANYLSSLGVNLIIGNHAHVVQPVDYVNNTLVIYSLGNFLSSQGWLGTDMVTSALVGFDIVVKKDKVSFENLDYKLLYTDYDLDTVKNYKIIPYDDLNDDILPNYQVIKQKTLEILQTKVN